MKIGDYIGEAVSAQLFGNSGHMGKDIRNAIEGLDLIELLRASPSPAHWKLADALEAAAA